MTWVLIIWSALILIWVAAGVGGSNCADETSSSATSGCEAGTAIGVFLILFIGFVGFLFLSLIWFMSRPKGRACPVCGEKVKKGLTKCESCGFDFSQAIAGTTGTTEPLPAGPPPVDSAPRQPESET
jgi:hypothetical protein